jgi:hypothetical protein
MLPVMSSSKRNQLTEKIVVNRIAKKISWMQLAEACARSEVWTTSALLGQQAMGLAKRPQPGSSSISAPKTSPCCSYRRQKVRSAARCQPIRSFTDSTRS